MKYILKGIGGQGVLFLSKVLGNILLLEGIENFSFLKEFDEGQRNGEIKVTFYLPFKKDNVLMKIKNRNIIELRKIVKNLKLDKKNVRKALKEIKPDSFDNNWKIYNEEN